MYRRVTEEEKQAFLKALSGGHTIKAASAAGNHSRDTFRDIRERDAEFAAAWAEAYDQGTEALEDKLHKISTEGWDEIMEEFGPDGKLKRRTVNKRFQPAPLFFSLKARRPEVYRDNATVQVVGDAERPIEIAYSPPSLADIFALAQKLGVGIEGEATEVAELESGEG